MERTYTCREVAARQNVSLYSVWKWIREKKLNAISLGKEYRITAEDLAAFEKQRKTIAD